MTETSKPNAESTSPVADTGVYAIRIDYKDGRAEYPVIIDRANPGWEKQRAEATYFFRTEHRDDGIVTTEFALSPQNLEIANPELLPSWTDYQKERFSYEDEQDKSQQVLTQVRQIFCTH